LRLVDVATGEYVGLPGDLYSLSPTWDPGYTRHLIYDGERGLVNLDLDKNTTWAFTADPNDHSPVFSPDGSRIAVTHQQDNHWEIHVLNADGSGRAQLTGTPYIAWVEQMFNGEEFYSYNNASPAWSPDGSQIAFFTDQTGQWEIWVMNADGTGQQPLFPAGTLDGIPLQYNGMDEQMIAWR
jgi:Tol biopolymer transport system component